METDEVTYSEFRAACHRMQHLAGEMAGAEPDEMAQHYLPRLVEAEAVIFSFVGSNMTARHVPTYARTVAEREAARDRAGGVDYGRPTPS